MALITEVELELLLSKIDKKILYPILMSINSVKLVFKWVILCG